MSREEQRTQQLEKRFGRLMDELKEQDAQMASLYEDFDIDSQEAAEQASEFADLLGQPEAPPSTPAKPRIAIDHRFVLRA